ncbi:MAG: nucleotidyltransferase [Halopseudomonas sp.]
MPLNNNQYNSFLESVAQDLDIPPSKYQQAVDRYKSVGRWLQDGVDVGAGEELRIYTQGSFRLGTVVRPLSDGSEADYDIDLVCELPCHHQSMGAHAVKHDIGNRLKESETYRRMLDKEGRRCWTLDYAEQDGIGFHLDVLPSASRTPGSFDTSISITHREKNAYSWYSSDPNGYANWFYELNRAAYRLAEHQQKTAIQRQHGSLYASIDEVPDQLIRTPLQRAIQLMKRHRDQRFDDHMMSDASPISMIITTLAAHLYANESDVRSTLLNIITRMQAHNSLLRNEALKDSFLAERALIQKRDDGTWYIGNPVNPDENFADRWHEDNHARARAFFQWVEWLKEDFINVEGSSESAVVQKALSQAVGAALVSRHALLLGMENDANTPPARKVNITSAPQPWRI